MKVYGALESAQIEWFTNAGKPAASSYPFRVIYVTDLKQIQVSDGTNWNPSALYTYTAGTLPAAGASNQYQVAFITDTLQVKVSDGSQWKTIGARLDTYTSGTIPAAASNTNSIIWVSDLQQVQVSNGTAWVQVGSKAGTKNYFTQNNANSDFETNSVSPWSACTLTFSSGVPSGAPTLTATQMAIATTATNPLSGTYSMQLTKSAANAQYQGFISGALTIDREDTAKVLYGSFYYEVVSGTIDLSGSSTQSLEIWIYNTVSGQWTQPSGYRGMNQSSGVGRVVFSFQTDGTYANNAYRIAVITQQTSTSSYVVEFDDFVVGPQAIVLGTAMTDKISFSPALTNAGNATATGTYQRIGSNALIEVIVTIGSSLPTGTIKVGKPNNLTFDYSGNTMINTSTVLGQTSASGATYAAGLRYEFSTSTFNLLGGNGQQFWNATVPVTWASGDKIYISATVPIAGWGSFSQMSSDTDTRIVTGQVSKSGTQAISAGTPTKVTGFTVNSDDAGMWDATNNWFKVAVSGYYRISGIARVGAAQVSCSYRLNGSTIYAISGYNTILVSGSVKSLTKLNAGDTLEMMVFTASAETLSASDTMFQVERLSGPSVITATESVSAAFTTSATGTSSTSAPINFDSKLWDSHNAVTIGSAWKFTAPVSGQYIISGRVSSTTSTYVIIYKSGSSYAGCGYNNATLDGGSNLSYSLRLNAGEYIDIRFNTSASWTSGPQNTGSNNTIIITRVGN